MIKSHGAPGPIMVTLWVTNNAALVSVMVPVIPKLIVSPFPEAAIVSRNDPEPLSFKLVTVRVVAAEVAPLAWSQRAVTKVT